MLRKGKATLLFNLIRLIQARWLKRYINSGNDVFVSTPSHLSGLDGLRGLAALSVLMLHVDLYFNIPSIGQIFDSHAYLAVDSFYMISGFVITHSFDCKMEQGMTVSRFYLSRVLRLYPMLVAGATVGAITLGSFWFLHREIPLSSMLAAGLSGLFLIPTYAFVQYKPYVFPLNASYWSLFFEFLLYAFYALAFRPLKRSEVLTSTLLVSAGALVWVSASAGGLDVGYRAEDFPLGFGRALLPFLAGMTIRRSRLYRPNSLRFGSLALVMAIPLFCNPFAKSGFHDAAAVLVLLPFIITCLANAEKFAGLDRVWDLLGELSYPVYAIHYPIVVACANACKLLHLPAFVNALAAISCIIVIIAAATVLSRCYDRPVRAALKRLFEKNGHIKGSEASGWQASAEGYSRCADIPVSIIDAHLASPPSRDHWPRGQ